MTKEQELLNNSFFKNFLKYSEHMESPDPYFLWTALSLLGAVCRRKVYYDQIRFKVYTNFYTSLVSESAVARKSVAMDTGMSLFNKAYPEGIQGMEVLQGKITPQAISELLAPKQGEPRGMMFVQADELEVFLSKDVVAANLPELLTELYGCPTKHEYLTKTAGKFKLRNVFFNILAGTVPAHLHESMGSSKTKGLIGRFSFCLQNKRKRSTPRLDQVIDLVEDARLQKVLVQQLREVGLKAGKFKFTDEAGEQYDRWYTELGNSPKVLDTSVKATGFIARMGSHVIKVAMVNALGKKPFSEKELIIRPPDIQTGINITEKAEKSLARIFDTMPGPGPLEWLPKIQAFIQKNRRVSRTYLMQNFSKQLLATDLDNIMRALIESKICVSVQSKGLYYYFVPPVLRNETSMEVIKRAVVDEFNK